MNDSELFKKLESLQTKQDLLKKCIDHFYCSNDLAQKNNYIQIGVELEFYLTRSSTAKVATDEERESFISLFNQESQFLPSKNCKKNQKINEVLCKTEQGNGQIEVVFKHRRDLENLCLELDFIKEKLEQLAKKSGFECSFAGQPFSDDCGSALQFSISLHNKTDKNLFGEDIFLAKKYAEKLLILTNEMLIFLAPNEEDYLRFSYDLNRKLHKNGKHTAPVNLSLGKENRSCAVRLAQKCHRLEYRVPSASADIWLSLSCLLLALCDLKNSGDKNLANSSTKKFEEIYGNSFDEQYCLKPLIGSLDEAKKCFLEEGSFFKRRLKEILGDLGLLN